MTMARTNTPTGGRKTLNTKFGEHDNSIAATINRLPLDVQAKYRENRMNYREECDIWEQWHSAGGMSRWEVDSDD